MILWSHDTRIPAIGYSEKVGVKDGSLGGNIIFNERPVDPFGWGIGMRVGSGAIRAGSVGFMVNKVELSEKDEEEEEITLDDVNLSLNGDENEEEVKTFWKGLIKQMDGGIK